MPHTSYQIGQEKPHKFIYFVLTSSIWQHRALECVAQTQNIGMDSRNGLVDN